MTVIWRGTPGHFQGARSCCFFLHTEIDGAWRVSTVGCYHGAAIAPRDRTDENRHPLGGVARGPNETWYETMVFALTNGEPAHEATELARYSTEDAAEKGHAALVAKYKEIAF